MNPSLTKTQTKVLEAIKAGAIKKYKEIFYYSVPTSVRRSGMMLITPATRKALFKKGYIKDVNILE